MSHPDEDDPLASATLALLYMQQGHDDKARAVLDAVLVREPAHGPALALRERLRALEPGRVRCERRGDALVVRWGGVPAAPRRPLHLVIHAVLVDSATATVVPRVTSVVVDRAIGEVDLPLPPGRCSLVASVGEVGDRGFRPFASSDVLVL